MSERGMIGAAVLWILAAASALALASLTIAKAEVARGRNEIQQVKLLSLIQLSAALEQESNFAVSQNDRTFLTGQVHLDRTMQIGNQELNLLCLAKSGTAEKKAEIVWKRIGGQWRAIYWREL